MYTQWAKANGRRLPFGIRKIKSSNPPRIGSEEKITKTINKKLYLFIVQKVKLSL
jgi:hypothetical protein